MKVQIESGISIPDKKGNSKYPWSEMKVGDSFLHLAKNNAVARSAANLAGKRLGFVFATRKTEEGVRIWRIK